VISGRIPAANPSNSPAKSTFRGNYPFRCETGVSIAAAQLKAGAVMVWGDRWVKNDIYFVISQ
jgi:hypothetical protein